jgi:hypothetical protein
MQVNTVPMLKECPRRWRECSVEKTAHNRQCVETIQEEPKLKYPCQASQIYRKLRENFLGLLQHFNMVKIESRLQTST